MNQMLSVWIQSLRARRPGSRDANPTNLAGDLLERAGACCGRDPRCAAELRGSAIAWLGVVR